MNIESRLDEIEKHAREQIERHSKLGCVSPVHENQLLLAAVARAAVPAEDSLSYAASVFNDDRFTDRHEMGPVFTERRNALRAALRALESE